jgi:hypothetical protein
MATYVNIEPTQKLDPFKAVKKIPLEESSSPRVTGRARAASRRW